MRKHSGTRNRSRLRIENYLPDVRDTAFGRFDDAIGVLGATILC